MRVDLRRCDRCHGEYDANRVAEPLDIKRFTGQPVDLCDDCNTLVISVLDELPPVTNQGNGTHLWSGATRGYVDHQTERLRHEMDRDLRAAVTYTDDVAARPLVIP